MNSDDGEAVLGGMLHEEAVGPLVERVTGDLLEVEAPARLEHAADLGHGGLPVGHVVDDREVEHGVEARVLGIDRRHVADLDAQTIGGEALQPGARARHHVLVDVHRKH